MNQRLKFGSKAKMGSVASVAFTLGVLMMFMLTPHGLTVNVGQNLGGDGRVVNVVITRHGLVIYNYTTHNALTNPRPHYLRNQFGFGNASSTVTIVAAGNFTGTPAITDATLTTEDTVTCTRTNATTTTVNATCYQCVKQWATVAAAVTVNATALCTTLTPSASDAVAIATITQAVLAAGDTLTITWTNNAVAA